MPFTTRFQPNWYESRAASNGDDKPDQFRAEPSEPISAPLEVMELVARTYNPHSQPQIMSTTFTLFPKLPVELRRMIWRYSLPGSRLVALFWDESIGVCNTTCPPPTALLVNQEARNVALECYKLCFGTSEAPARIYFDMEIDELYLGVGNIVSSIRGPVGALLSTLALQELAQVRHLVVDEDMRQYDESLSKIQIIMGDLRTVTRIRIGGYADFVREQVSTKPVQYDCWLFDEDGRIQRWPNKTIGEGQEHNLEVKGEFISEETEKLITKRKFRRVSRFVTQERLKKESRWTKRMEFLQATIVWDNTCLYPKDGLIEKLIDMEHLHPAKYGELSLLVTGSSEWVLDPLLVYACQTACVCPVGHKKKAKCPDWFPDISGVDLRALLKKVEGTGSS